ncbi:hypothetical protein FML66_11605 [Klebsiella oxytoca]|uniref:hypothetical protein n=1 Tax=Klebsiella oxytoca TaxID=571 RepID=UPI000A9A557E|nr:hypothetical protein [Klebsiella oxytoca]MBZ7909510.1 hypothetical protein [Klebsiella oxytoca]VEF71631.1 Uncharacterised protein [Klebsiella oxytoca]VGO98110.1 hypothetical protein SB00175_01702 [Klebsiella oxytoca]
MIYHWAALPAFFMRYSGLKNLNDKRPSSDIAAMKLYIVFAIKIRTHGNKGAVSLSYDELTEMAGLSRTLVSRGLKQLCAYNLILITGDRKKFYSLKSNTAYKGWTKIPVKPLIDDNGNVFIFSSFRNRYDYELNALRLYLYLLYARSNSDCFTEVSYATIYERIGIGYSKIDNALSFLKSCGLLLDRQITESSMRIFPLRDDHLQAYRYTLLGGEYLTRGSVIREATQE